MATEIGNQLLARVRDEMGRNIATIKRQLIEWLERPESGGIEILRDKLAEISGGLSLIGQDEAVALADAIIAGVSDLSQGVAQHGVDAAFAGHGAELAAGLLVLTDYIERLDHLSEHNRQAVIQATEAVKSIAAADKDTVHVAAQPFISKETYQALAAKINEIIETSRNQIEEYIRNPEAPFNTTTIIEANKNLISFFAVLELKTPQALLQQINQQISAQLSEQQWIDIAEAMILVQESLKHAEHDETIRQTDNFRDAVQAQAAHSRLLEVEKLIHDTGKLGRRFFEALRKEVLHAETIKQEQPWQEATTQLVHYSAITALAGLKELAAQLQHFGLLCAEFTLQKDETLAKTYAPVIDALVAVEYLFNDLAETGKISLHDVGFLAEAVGNIDKVCPVSAQAKNLFVQFANMAPPDDGEEEGSGDIEEFKDVLESALDVLDDDFSMLEELEEEEEPELPSVMLAGTHAGSGAPATAAAGLAQLEHSDSAAAIPVNQNAAGVGINAPLAGQGAAEQAGGTETAATPAAEIPASRATATATVETTPSEATATATVESAPSEATATATVESAPSEATAAAATETAPSEITTAPVAEIATAPSETTVAPVAETAPSEATGASSSGQQAAVVASGALPAVAYFASKSLDDLQTMDVPAEKVSFVGSHADAVMDEEIREFFNEELAEIVATMNDVYPQWREASDDARLTGDIRRAFHTLKGSGRTVGYESLGEFAWQHEQLLNRVIEKDYPANSLVRDTVGDAISLLNVLHQGEEFVEHKGALLQQALVAERVRLSLLDAPQSEQDALDALSRKLRLSDGGDVPSGEPVNAVAVTTTPASETADDWAAFDDIALDTPTSDEPPTITLAEDDFSVEKERISPEETASATTTHHDGAGIDFAPADEHTATTSHDTAADGEHGGMDFAFAEDDTSHAAAHTATARHDATADGEHSGVDFAFVEDGGSHAAAHTATDRNDAAADGEHGGMDFAFVEDDVSHAAAHTATARHDAAADGEHGGIDFAFVEDDANHAAGQTVAASVHHAAQHDDTVAMDFALSDSHATSDITSATPAEEIKAADVSGSESYDKALRTLQRGLRMGEPDADMQAALAETIRRQWQQSMMDDPDMRAAMTQSLIESFKGDSVSQAQWVSDILAQANAAGNASVPVQPGLVPQMAGAPVHVAPSGISQEAYDRMLTTLRRGLAAGADEDMQAVLSDTISRQWLQQGIDTEGETRDAIISQLKASLLEEGVADEAVLDAMLETVPHRVPSVLPEGVRQDSYGIMMETLRAGLGNASSADVQEMLATAIGNQWQNQNSLQDSAIRAAVAEQMAAVLGGNGQENSALVEAVLNRAAEKAREVPAGIKPDDYHNMLDTLRSNIGEAHSAEEQDALAASISAHWQEHSLQDEATRDAVAQRIIAALGGKTETDSAAVEAVLNRVAEKMAQQQAAAAPSETTAGFTTAYGAGVQLTPSEITADSADEQAASISLAPSEHPAGDAVRGVAIEATILPQGVRQESYGAMLQTLQAGISAVQGDSAAQEALAASIGAQWQEAHTLQDPVARAAVAQQISAALGDQADTATVEAVLNRAAAQVGELPQGVEQAAYGAMLQTLQAGISAAQGDSAAQETLAAGIAAQWQSAESLQDPAVRATVAQQISAALGDSADTATVEAVLNRAAAQAIGLPQGVEQTSYSTMLQTLQAGIGAAQDDAVAQEALAASIGAQWQTADTLHDPAARATVAQQISAALGDKADTASIEHILERAAVQAGFLPPGVRQDAYGSMLQTLQAGIGIAQNDTAAQEMLAATVGAQWQEPQSLQDDAARITVAAQIAAALGDKADVADVEAVLNRAARQAAELPQGVRQEAYGRMLHSMRFGEIHGEGIEQEMLAAAVGAQWEEPYSLQDAATRASVAQQLATALGGVADTAAVSAILDRAAHQAAQLPAGVNQDGYGAILQALRSHLDADVSDATTQEVLAATIGSQWQDAHSLQDDVARAAFAQQISAAFDGAMEETAVAAVLDRAAAQAAQLPQDVHQSAYGAMLQKLHAGIGEARDNPAAQEALAAAIGARWREEHTLQDPVARATVAQQLTAALGDAADVATVEAVLNRAAAQAGFLPPDVRQEAYGDILHTLHAGIGAGQDNAVAAEALAASIGAQWQEAHTLHDPAARAAVAQQLTAALGDKADAANIEAVLNRAAAQAGELPQGVKQGAYGAMLQTLQAGIGAAKDDVAAQEALAASISTQWQEQHSLQDPAIRAAMAQKLSDSLGGEADAATVAAILERAAVKAADDAAQPESLSADSYNHLLSLLRRGLKDGDADTQAALAATLQRQWQKQALPQDAAAVDAVQQQLAADGIDGAHLAEIFAAAGLSGSGQPSGEVVVKAVLSQDSADAAAAVDAPVVKAAASEHMHDDFVDMAAESAPAAEPADTFVDAAADAHDDHAHVATDFLDIAADSHDAADAEIYPVADADEATSDFIDTAGVPGDVEPLPEENELPVMLGGMTATTIGGQGKGGPAISATPTSVVQIAPSRGMSPAERLNRELASLAQHPGLDGAVQGGKAGEGSATNNRAGFLRAVDQFDTLSQLADKNESPEIIDDLIDAVYDIEDSIDSEVAPPWIWRLLDSIEQLLLTHKQEGTPVSLSCAAVLRQSARLIENFEEDANEEDAIEAINALLNARREVGGGKSSSEPTALPYSGDPLGSELVEDPNANTMLAETFIDEAMSLFAHSQEEAERWDENRDQLSRLDAIRRDMHTLKGSARMAGYNAIGDLTHGVESLIDGIVSGQAEASSKATSILVGAMWQGMLMLDTVRDGYLPQTDPYILNNIHSYLNQPLPYPEVAEAAELARQEAREEAAAVAAAQAARIEAKDLAPEPAEETPVEEVAVVTEFDDNIDPVLVDIFTDEAQELLQTTSQLLEDDFSKSEVVEELQRTMHTLKGGARLVGFTAIGDTAHLMESVIDKIPDLSEGKVRQAKTLLHFGLDAHYEMLDSVMRHEMPQPALEVNESLKVFADSGQYRVPSQGKGRAEADEGTPDEQATADNVPSEAPGEPAAADSKGGQTPSESAADTGATSSAKGEGASRSEPARADSHSGGHTDDAAASTAPSSATPASAHSDKAHDDSKAADKAPAAQADKHDTLPDHTPDLEKERGSGISSVPEAKADKPETAKDKEKDSKDSSSGDNLPRYVRVDAQLLDEMIAMTGETAIMRSRMENIISEAEFNLTELTRVATRIAEQMRRLDSETEAQMLYRREQQGEDDLHFDPLEMDRFSEIQQLSRQLSEAIDDLKNLQDTLSQDNTTLRNLSIQQGIIQRGIQDHLLTTQLMRFDVHEARLRRLVRQTAKSVGKDVNFILEGGEVEVERRLLEDILPALEHMIRNSLAHGIETPEARLATGKSETGTIKVKVGVHAAELSVDVLDDGQGLNYERIRDKAAAKGMLDPERADDESYLSSLILRSGFSTAESLSQLAGRGVGMDVVNEMVKQRRGQIVVRSKRGEGTMFTLNMPFSMSIAEVLLVEIAGQTFAAPMSSIKAIGQVSHNILQRSVDGEIVYQNYEDKDYRQFVLGAYFKPDQYSLSDEEAGAPVLFINSEDNPVAFHVDRILNRLEIIVKNVNRQVLNIPGISGATILGDGRVVPVLELLDLSRRIADLTTLRAQRAAEVEVTVPNILVVDDSVTMRKVSTRLLERHHYNVATAKDGLDAIEVLNSFTPDVILLDIEMPRMDGFEFASHVRHGSNVPDVPIVMITSRTGDKHRERADAIGVQGYLGKPYSEDMLIQTLEFLLKKGGDN